MKGEGAIPEADRGLEGEGGHPEPISEVNKTERRWKEMEVIPAAIRGVKRERGHTCS